MGGFEGGDEAGFWEVDENTLFSRNSKTSNNTKYQIIQDDLIYKIKADGYDGTITLLPFKSNDLTIDGYKTDIISKTYKALVDFTDDMEIVEFFQEHKVFIDVPYSQNIDDAMLGALFILLTKDVCNLVLNNHELENIANSIVADITPLL
jgi:hypothetical protein